MKLKLHHTPYIAKKIARDLAKTDFIEIRKTLDEIAYEIEKILDEDIEKELDLDEAVYEKLEEIADDIEFYNADDRVLFREIKKRLANEYGVILNYNERFNNLAHQILDFLWEEDFIHYEVNDNRVKNVIFESLQSFLKGFEEAEDIVLDKLKNYKRKLIPGTDEYDIMYHKLYEEELIRRGLI